LWWLISFHIPPKTARNPKDRQHPRIHFIKKGMGALLISVQVLF